MRPRNGDVSANRTAPSPPYEPASVERKTIVCETWTAASTGDTGRA